MTSDNKNTLVDRWIGSIKNQPILASLIFTGVVIGAIASFTESISKIAKFWREKQEIGSIAGASQLKPDYSKHTRLWYPSLLHPELRLKVEALRKFAAESNINLQYFETYRPPEVQHQMFMGPPPTTYADAWSSPKQYGMAATLWIYDQSGWTKEPSEELAEKLALMATTVGLRQEGKQGIFVPWTYTLPNTRISDLKAGRYPSAAEDDPWIKNLNSQIGSWGSKSPPAPPLVGKK
jgi:hypothetical protein